jgi:hypothetical protein
MGEGGGMTKSEIDDLMRGQIAAAYQKMLEAIEKWQELKSLHDHWLKMETLSDTLAAQQKEKT